MNHENKSKAFLYTAIAFGLLSAFLGAMLWQSRSADKSLQTDSNHLAKTAHQDSTDFTNSRHLDEKLRQSGNNEQVSATTSSANFDKLEKTRKAASLANQLSSENAYLLNKSVNATVVDKQLNSKNFQSIYNDLELDMLKDSMAIDLRDAYQDEIKLKLKLNEPSLSLTRLACGLRLCIGSVKSNTAASLEGWDDALVSAESSIPGIYSVIQSQVFPEGDEFEQRFLFTNNQENNSIIMQP